MVSFLVTVLFPTPISPSFSGRGPEWWHRRPPLRISRSFLPSPVTLFDLHPSLFSVPCRPAARRRLPVLSLSPVSDLFRESVSHRLPAFDSATPRFLGSLL